MCEHVICVHVCIVYVCMFACVVMCMCVCVYVCVYVCVCVNVCGCMLMQNCTCGHTYILYTLLSNCQIAIINSISHYTKPDMQFDRIVTKMIFNPTTTLYQSHYKKCPNAVASAVL